MTIQSGFFNSINGDRKYDATWFAQYFASFIGNGVFPNPSTGLQVVEDDNMNIVVKAGKGWINGYYIVNDDDYVLTLDNADGVLKRIDRVVMRLNYLTRQIEIDVKKGAFASNPVAPTLQRDSDAYELALADILINNGVLQITQANITDTRLNNDLCGIVHGLVEQVDTTTLFAQYESWYTQTVGEAGVAFENMQEQLEQDFNDWFATIQNILDENVAANLLQMINEHAATNATTTTKGHVELSSATNSEDETKAATPKAVKLAYDRAEAAFQAGNSRKNETVDALLRVDDSLPISAESSWNAVIDSIGNISTGKNYAESVVSESIQANGELSIALDFEPKFVILRMDNTFFGATIKNVGGGRISNAGGTTEPITVSTFGEKSFTIRNARSYATSIYWYAFS